MSTINNIPFDINRTAVDKNANTKPVVANPVQHSEAIHPTAVHNNTQDRRSGGDRRKTKRPAKLEKRHLTERRQKHLKEDESEQLAVLKKSSGSIIDLQV